MAAGFRSTAEPSPDAGNLADEEQTSFDERPLEGRLALSNDRPVGEQRKGKYKDFSRRYPHPCTIAPLVQTTV